MLFGKGTAIAVPFFCEDSSAIYLMVSFAEAGLMLDSFISQQSLPSDNFVDDLKVINEGCLLILAVVKEALCKTEAKKK